MTARTASATANHRGLHIVLALWAVVWLAAAVLGGGMDLGLGIPGRGPTGAMVALTLGTPLAVTALWLVRRRWTWRGPAGCVQAGAVGLTLLSWASIGWALDPAQAWLAGNREAVLLGAATIGLAAGLGLPDAARRLSSLVAVGAVAIAAVAVLTHALPGVLGTDGAPARLASPVDYPNALALVMASGLPGVVLAGPERGRMWIPARAAAAALLLCTLALTLSRSGIAAVVVGVCVALALTGGARRAAAVVAAGTAGAVVPVAFSLGTRALSTDGLDVADRVAPGRAFGGLVVVGLVLAGVAAGPLVRVARIARVPAPRRVLAVAAVLVALSPAAALTFDAESVTACGRGTVANTPGRITDISGNQRGAWWCEAARGWAHAPVLGNGAGSFPQVQVRERRDDDRQLTPRDPHQVFLAPASALGIVGLLLTLSVWAGAAWAALRLRRRVPAGIAAILAAGAVQAQTDWTLSWPASGMAVMAAAGVLAGLAASQRRVAHAVRGEPLAVAALALAVLAGVGAGLLPWMSDRAADRAATLRIAGDLPGSMRAARTAQRLNPWSLEPFQQRALTLLASGDRSGAVAALRDGTRVQPRNPEAWRWLALRLGGDPAAKAAWARVHRLDPFASDARHVLGLPDAFPAPG